MNPLKIPGPWTEGFALDQHVESSVPTGGLTPGGYTEFDTKRTELGELVYQLKYKGKLDVAPTIAAAVVEYTVGRWGGAAFDAVVPAPPSVTRRHQPAIQIASAVAESLGVPLKPNAVKKVKTTKQMKDVALHDRGGLLRDAIQKGSDSVSGERILLVDDVMESGATLGRVAEVLLADGKAKSVHVVVVTRTK